MGHTGFFRKLDICSWKTLGYFQMQHNSMYPLASKQSTTVQGNFYFCCLQSAVIWVPMGIVWHWFILINPSNLSSWSLILQGVEPLPCCLWPPSSCRRTCHFLSLLSLCSSLGALSKPSLCNILQPVLHCPAEKKWRGSEDWKMHSFLLWNPTWISLTTQREGGQGPLLVTAVRVSYFQHSIWSLQPARGSKFMKCLNLGQEIFLLVASWFPCLVCAGGVENKTSLLCGCSPFWKWAGIERKSWDKTPPSIRWHHPVLLLALEGLTWRKRTHKLR